MRSAMVTSCIHVTLKDFCKPRDGLREIPHPVVFYSSVVNLVMILLKGE